MNSLMRWEPFEDLVPLQRAMDRLFEESWVRPFGGRFGVGPSLDLYETDDDVVVKVALPGVKPEEVDVTVIGDRVTIQGETKVEEKDEKRNYFHREYRYGKFARSISLPTSVKADQAKAEFEHGILTLTLPKAEEVKPKTIKVKAK